MEATYFKFWIVYDRSRVGETKTTRFSATHAFVTSYFLVILVDVVHERERDGEKRQILWMQRQYRRIQIEERTSRNRVGALSRGKGS